MSSVIKQIVKDGQYGSQTIKMIVKSNERGPKGETGDTGPAATIEAGNAYSVGENNPPAVVNTGTASNAVFDFYIPKGERGNTGPQGETGPEGPVGPQGPQGEQGPAGKDGAIQYSPGAGKGGTPRPPGNL